MVSPLKNLLVGSSGKHEKGCTDKHPPQSINQRMDSLCFKKCSFLYIIIINIMISTIALYNKKAFLWKKKIKWEYMSASAIL